MVDNAPINWWDYLGYLSDKDFEETDEWCRPSDAYVRDIWGKDYGNLHIVTDPCPSKPVSKKVCKSCKKYTCKFTGTVIFTLTREYYKKKGVTVTGLLLRHEIGHVKIGDRALARYNKELNGIIGIGEECDLESAKKAAERDWLKTMNDKRLEILREYLDANKKYDKDTEHGTKGEEQKKYDALWKEK
jgi:hypothetical protein